MNQTNYPEPDISTRMEEERKIMDAYSDTAKSYTQLSIGALLLTITFSEKILGSNVVQYNGLLITTWILWLLSTLAGISYQYFAVRYIERLADKFNLIKRSNHFQIFEYFEKHPWIAYGMLLFSFYLGVIFFGIFGINAIN